MNNIRNFSIIAHVDHGKSTLSDRIIQICNGLSDREMEEQVLDSMALERERGITIKAQSVALNYKAKDGNNYQLNFIDTPGHVDFSYEVFRSLDACEGALLVVDAIQGIEAQTISNYYTAVEKNLKVIPVLNKIDLCNADPDRIAKEIKTIVGLDDTDVVRCSAKTGIGVINVLERLVRDIPAPKGDPNAPLQALIIDSWFNNYMGVVSLVRIKNGTVHKGDKIKVMSTGQIYHTSRLGIFTPKQIDRVKLKCGEVGWIICTIKNTNGAPVGDTLTNARDPAEKALPMVKKVKPQVYAGLFPMSPVNYSNFRDSLAKLSLNDSALSYEPESSSVLGFGFRCGFLGLLHMEIIQERLEREYNLNLITTAPTLIYEVQTINKEILYITSPSKLPPFNKIKELREPIAECNILLPQKYLGSIITLCIEKRGIQNKISYHDNNVALTYEMPMAEVVFDFFDRLKAISHGYASLSYSFKRFQASNIVRVDLLLNGMRVDELSLITHKSNASCYGHILIEKIKKLIPRQQFNITIQVAIGNRIINRSIITQLRKNVLAKCHGGDITRKKKLIQNQKEGKKRMKKIGNVNIPHEAFLAILNIKKNK